jgi:D-serine deaminase-like pyridoxal phosphate-dependent protein
LRPGNYDYVHRTQVALGAATLDDCALTVLATVVSKPAADRIIFDSGSKTLTNDGARGFTPAPGFGVVVDHPNLLIERLSEEHATVKVINGSTPLEPGDRVRIVPNHSCVVSNLVDQAWLVDGDAAAPLPIAARGKIS